MHRSTRQLRLTDDGRAFYDRAKVILSEVEQVAADLGARRGEILGSPRISAPVSFGSLHLGPALFGFLRQHPALDLTVDLEDRFVDLSKEGYDAVLRHGPIDNKRIIVKRLAVSRRVLVSSPTYLNRYGKPTSLKELAQHKGIIYSQRGGADWRFRVGRRFVTVDPTVCFRVNNGLLMRDAAGV